VKYASLKYDSCWNLGDEIQTLATEQHLPRVDSRIDRDSLASFEANEKHVVILQGWFSVSPERSFPPSDAIIPIFIGFHIRGRAREYLLSGARLDYLKAHEPIGCRDNGTRRMLERAGVRAYTTHCLTLTFPTREREPEHGLVFIVDGEDLPIPRSLRRGAVYVTHASSVSLGDEGKRIAAQQLLDSYRDHARLVITTKLHCALPCLAMGIPVVFFGEPDRNYRLDILKDLNVATVRRNPKHYRMRRACRFRIIRSLWDLWNGLGVDWDPAPLALETEKARLGEIVSRELSKTVESSAVREAI
jgi:hypothetical protein